MRTSLKRELWTARRSGPRRKRQAGTGKYGQPKPVGIGRAAQIPRQLMPRGETKCFDVVNATNGALQVPVACNDAALIFCINAVSTGSGAWNRIGRRITMKSLYLQGFFTSNLASITAASIAQNVRIMIIYDKQSNGANPALSDILRDQINNNGQDSNLTLQTSGLNMNNRDRFEIILDKRFMLPGCTAAGGPGIFNGGNQTNTVEEFRNLKGREVQFRSDSVPSTVADIAAGSLIMMTFGDRPNTASPFLFTFSCRIKYTD